MGDNAAGAAKEAKIIFQKIRPVLIGDAKNPKKILIAIEPTMGVFLAP